MEGDKSQEATAEVDQPTEATVADEEIKIVVAHKGSVGRVGVQKPDSDPVFARIEGDLPEVVASIPRLVDEARAKWEANPRNPKADLPAPPPPPPRAAARPAPAPQSQAQPAFF